MTQTAMVREDTGSAGGGLEVISLRELFEQPHDPVDGLWGRWLVPGEMTSPAARGGRGKTTLTRSVMAHGAAGRPCLGIAFARPLRWLYLTGEGSAPFWRRKMERVARGLRLDHEALARIHVAARGGDCGIRLSRPDHATDVRRVLDRLTCGEGLDVLVLDPFARFMHGDENASADMGRAVEAIIELQREFDIATWVPHHASQNGRGLDAFRGHTTFEGAIATGLLLTSLDRDRRKLDPVKVRYAEEPDDERPRFLRFDGEREIYVEDAAERGDVTTRERFDRELSDGEWHKVADLAERLGVTRQTLGASYIEPNRARGLIERKTGEHRAHYVRRSGEREGVLWDSS